MLTAGSGTGSGDAAARGAIRRNNVSVVLRHLRRGARSRTEISRDLGLPNSTVSKLVGELVELGLVTDDERRRAGGIGRPHQAVALRAGARCGLGVEISVNYIRVIALDLPGDVLLDDRAPVDHDRRNHQATLDLTADLVTAALTALRATGTAVTGVTVAAPGHVDRDAGVVRLATNLGWSDLPLATELADRLGPDAPLVRVDNDARLGTVAEHRVAHVPSLLYLTGEVGVAGGIVVDDTLVLGAAHSAGELGHMPLDPRGAACPCGQRGCFETMVGLGTFLSYAADATDPLRDQRRDLEERLALGTARAAAGDARTVRAVDRIAADLGLGLGLLVNVLDPAVVVLGGYFSHLGEPLLSRVRAEVTGRVLAPHAGGCDVRLSRLGFTAAARGAAETVLDDVFTDPAAFGVPVP